MPDNLATQTADHDERALLTKVTAKLEEVHKLLQPPSKDAPDPYACIRGSIRDLISDIDAEATDLTDTIGDEIDYGGRAA